MESYKSQFSDLIYYCDSCKVIQINNDSCLSCKIKSNLIGFLEEN